MFRYINDDLENSSDDSDRGQIKSKYHHNVYFEGTILKF